MLQKKMSTKKYVQNQVTGRNQQHREANSGIGNQLTKNQILGIKSYQRDHLSVMNHSKYGHSTELYPDKVNLGAMLEAVCNQVHQENEDDYGDVMKSITDRNYDQLDDINVQLVQISAKAFVDQMFMDRNYVSKKEKEFSDAMEVLCSNRDLFLKLLEDPNSLLLKHIKNLHCAKTNKRRCKSFLDAEFSECGRPDTRHCDKSKHIMKIQKQNMNKLLWERIQSQYGYSAKAHSSQPSNKIIVLKPKSKDIKYSEAVSCHCSSLQSHHRSSKGKNINSSYFSLESIKRKLKGVTRENQKNKQMSSMDDMLRKLRHQKRTLKAGDKVTSIETSARRHSNLSADAGKRNEIKLKNLISREEVETTLKPETMGKRMDSTSVTSARKLNFDILLEAKRHLSDRLRTVDNFENQSNQQLPRTLGRILSSPEQDELLTFSHGQDKRQLFLSTEVQYYSCRDFQVPNEGNSEDQKEQKTSCLRPLRQTEEVQSSNFGIFDEQFNVTTYKYPDNCCINSVVHSERNLAKEDLISNGHEEIMEVDGVLHHGDLSTSIIISQSCANENFRSRESTDTTKRSFDKSVVSPSGSHSPISTVDVNPSSPSSIDGQNGLDCGRDKEGHPSPISVLEPFLVEDVSSPLSITSQLELAGSPIKPLRLDFDEYAQLMSPQDSALKSSPCSNIETTVSTYVRSVLRACQMNRDEMLVHRPLPEDLQSISFFEETELLPTEFGFDNQLFLDYINEVLVDVYEFYACSPWVSFLKPKIGPVPLEKHVVNVVTEGVRLYLLPQLATSTLQQLVGKDVNRSSSWLDIRQDTEDIVVQIAEDFVEESIMDVILNFYM